MAANVEIAGGRRWSPWRLAGWGIAAGIILLPLVAMQFTKEVDWTPFDFAFAIILIGGVGLVFELAVRMTSSWAYRAGAALALAAGFLTIWINGAVGMIGDEGNPYNLLFGGVLLIALAGAFIARFRTAGMARVMLVAGLAHIAIGALAAFGLGGPVEPLEVILTILFATPWLLSAALFRKAGRDRVREDAAA